MNTITEHYLEIYNNAIDEFCFALLNNRSEALVAGSHAFYLLDRLVEKGGDWIHNEKDVKAFLYISARNYCFNRLRHLNLIKKLSWKKKVKRTFKNTFKSIMNMRRFMNCPKI